MLKDYVLLTHADDWIAASLLATYCWAARLEGTIAQNSLIQGTKSAPSFEMFIANTDNEF
jgi:hypothetical protein